MEKYKKFTGVLIFIAIIVALIIGAVKFIWPRFEEKNGLESNIQELQATLADRQQKEANIKQNIAKIQNSIMNAQKKLYAPIESDLGNDTLFFTLYNDVIEMLHSNSIKIKSISYQYNPEQDAFVQVNQNGLYFVCDVNMELVSNYINLGKLIQDIYQYPYYIRIIDLDVKPYQKDKTILLSTLNLRLYARTAPEEVALNKMGEGASEDASAAENAPLEGASSPIPQE